MLKLLQDAAIAAIAAYPGLSGFKAGSELPLP